jgi:hypothetical protein
MCIQEDERIKEARGDSINHMKHHKKNNYSNSTQSKKSYLMTLRPFLPRHKVKLP